MSQISRKSEERKLTPGKLGAVRRSKPEDGGIDFSGVVHTRETSVLFSEDIATSTSLELSPQNSSIIRDRRASSLSSSRPGNLMDRELAKASDRELGAARAQPKPAAAGAVIESAASQIVSKTLKMIGANDTPSRTPSSSSAAFRQETRFILDKGLEAINGVSRLMEGFALTLDSVIEKAFEDWGTPVVNTAESVTSSGPSTSNDDESGSVTESTACRDDAKVVQATPAGSLSFLDNITTSHPPSPSGVEADCWRKRALILSEELAQLKAKQDQLQDIEIRELQLKRERVQLTHAPKEVESFGEAQLSRQLKVDNVAVEQVTEQLQLLLTEKARLAQDNARLIRENNGLQELLEFTMAQQGEELGDEYAGDELV